MLEPEKYLQYWREMLVEIPSEIENAKSVWYVVVPKRGMTEGHFNSYDSDQVKAVVDTYADPCALIDLKKKEVDTERYVIIRVNEFDEIPVICKRSYSDVLHEGTIYTRSMGGKPESIPVPSQTEMREIIRMAVTKGVRRWFEQTKEIGVPIEADEAKFKRQLEDLL